VLLTNGRCLPSLPDVVEVQQLIPGCQKPFLQTAETRSAWPAQTFDDYYIVVFRSSFVTATPVVLTAAQVFLLIAAALA